MEKGFSCLENGRKNILKKKYKTKKSSVIIDQQTYGKANKKIKKYLQKYISYYQNDWEKLLLMLKYTYNIRRIETRIYTLYQIVYRETSEVTTKKIMKKNSNLWTKIWQDDTERREKPDSAIQEKWLDLFKEKKEEKR